MNIDVADALERARGDRGRSGAVGPHERQAIADRWFLAEEIRRLHEEFPFVWLLGFRACQDGEAATANPYDRRRQ